ncbi:hypothetical protein BC834DRAFT_52657 [Gloeopeniophorella convolvens]|nr:hypothetical protein BC834DRAFT_52657 [Gloeopeniophorella convolvens]
MSIPQQHRSISPEPDFAVDEYRRMKVVCIGAGFSGIIAAIRITGRVSHLDLTIHDKESGIGGTWYKNRYPGLACDIPSHCYQLSFENNMEWSGVYASGPEILADMQRIIQKYKLMRYIRLQHELTHAAWDEEAGVQRLRILHGDKEVEDTADIVFLGMRLLSRQKWPNILGLQDFKGRLCIAPKGARRIC